VQSLADELSYFLKLGQVAEHRVPHYRVEPVQQIYHVRHQLRLVLLHQLVKQRKHVLEQ